MRKTLLLILVFVLAQSTCCFGFSIQNINLSNIKVSETSATTTTAAITAYCTGAATCTAIKPGSCDLLCEDFEGATSCATSYDSNCRNTYTVTVGTGSSIDFTTSPPSSTCTDIGSNAVNVATTSSGQSSNFSKNLGADKTIVYGEFYFYLNSFTLSGTQSIFTILDSSTNGSYYISLYNNSGTYNIRLECNGCAGTHTGSTPILTGTWYRIGFEANTTADTAAIYLNGNLETSASDYVSTRIPRNIIFGPNSAGYRQATGWSVVYDNISVSAVALPGGCN